MSYKIQLNQQELNLFNIHEYDKRRCKLMSLYSYMIYISDNNELRISYSKLLKRYNKNHKKYKMALTTIKDDINRLIKLNLLKIVSVVKKVNVYSFVRFNFNEFTTVKPLKNPTCEEVHQNVENTEVQDSYNSYKYINNNTIDIDNKGKVYKKSYDEFIKHQEKVKNINTVIKRAKKLFKLKKIKNNLIKNKVLQQLNKYYYNITVKFLDNYILKTIAKTISDIKSIKSKLKQEKIDFKAKTLRFNDYEQRVYDYDKLEKKLLGLAEIDDNSELSELEIKNCNNSYNNNYVHNKKLVFCDYEQRDPSYYNKLEYKLLGWE